MMNLDYVLSQLNYVWVCTCIIYRIGLIRITHLRSLVIICADELMHDTTLSLECVPALMTAARTLNTDTNDFIRYGGVCNRGVVFTHTHDLFTYTFYYPPE